ncbi:MAG: cytochrome c biogenesis protein CcdA, partial [Candidatus Pacearchaeota archaeon]|nr:cytochrome c biogenesis protein CcdA [Candidatus Pacearchaeota archaeon]
MKKIVLITILMSLLFMSPLVLSQETELLYGENEKNLPPNLQKIAEYNNQQAQFYLKNLSFLIAFLAGIIGILTPCSLAILPAFFAYSFKEKKEITRMTLFFFLGFMPVFVVFGLVATLFGKSIAIFQQANSFFVSLAGFILIFFGLMTFLGKGFSGIQFNKKTGKTPFGIFLFGILFALGFTACMGPILAGILLIAGVLQNYLYAASLMLFYSLGLFVPLFLIAIFFDKYNFANLMNRIDKRLGYSITNIISGGLLILMGLIFIIYGGTYIINNLGLGSLVVS